ncbi:NAD(P)H-dependent oxidoreductase [Radiobacillus deserti]|uniref:NAD(P)H-dependent oxidoreductase n=1 Tax=Radiobacillus deserti TaxID=2594883 RepID=A0A516KG14_9BACI|nr:NAD(P)H-dependent oxidoreductase [Radiobacillus deserti]QDP40352.1 NAD(P)H-dependent oxidoreductase [Radiobacillus deserti]
MRTLLIVSHPDIIESYSQQYFLNSIKDVEEVTVRHLETIYPNGNINPTEEQRLLKEHDRIIFQFPFYWYSSPPLLKHWQDVVLEEGVTHGPSSTMLKGKEFGLVLMIGVSEREYQAGGSEHFTISELTKPFQALAHKTGMEYLPSLDIFQFAYMEDEQKMDMLIRYWQKLTMENGESLTVRERWLVNKLERSFLQIHESDDQNVIRHAIHILEENQMTIHDLKMVLDQIQHP